MFDVDQFIADCREALTESQAALAVKGLVERAVSRPADVDAALGEADRWGIHSLYASADLTIVQFVWPPGVVLFPHDHQRWAANGIYGGSEDNSYYRRTPTGIEASGGTQLRTGDVALLGSEVIHSVANPHVTYTAAIHVYGGDFYDARRRQWDAVTGEEQPFDIEAVRRTLADADALNRPDV
jgi:predicted metal-dependent enzyme (double-stranded beta helix superfamily)